jgi:hypothetical protein
VSQDDRLPGNFPDEDPDTLASTPPESLPERLWTICYSYGSPFSTGPIGQEAVFLFSDAEQAEAAIPQALEAEPDAGELHVEFIEVAQLTERYAFAAYLDPEGNLWPVLLSEGDSEDGHPLPDEPLALFVYGGGIDRNRDIAEDGDWVVHRDDDSGRDFVLFFEDMDTAQQVQKDFEEATGDSAQIRRTRADTLKADQSVRYYHASGQVEDLPREEYLRRCR